MLTATTLALNYMVFLLVAQQIQVHGAPVPLPYQTVSALRTLSPSAKAVAMTEIDTMGNFEPDKMFVNDASEGKFYVVEDLPTLPKRNSLRLERMISGTAALNYTSEGEHA